MTPMEAFLEAIRARAMRVLNVEDWDGNDPEIDALRDALLDIVGAIDGEVDL